MNAYEARKITDESLKSSVIEPYMSFIYARIKSAAEAGRFSLPHPLTGSAMPYPTTEQRDAIWAALTANGYKVKIHPDPDPGHPASGPYTEIYW